MTDARTPGSWTPAWVRDAVFYQIFPDRFASSQRVVKPGHLEPWDGPPTTYGFKGGDLLGIVEHLDHIQALSANALYLNPVFQSASNHRYHTYDYLRVDPLLGGDAALRELLDACHARGMRVILDGVFNHASRGFWPFHHVMETGRSSPYRDWFFFDVAALEAGRPLRAYPDQTAEPAAETSALARLGYEAWWGLPALPKLNTTNPDVRAYLLDVAEHWIRFGADGWRLDVPEEVPDDFWRAFRTRVRAANPEAYIVAEIWHEQPDDLHGDMYDALMDYPLAAAILSFVAATTLDRHLVDQHETLRPMIWPTDGAGFAERISRAMTVYPRDVTEVQLHLLGSHDTPRFLTMAGGDASALRLATLLQMTLPGAPSIYYGDEVGLTGGMDPGCRGTMPWDRPEMWDHGLLAFVAGAGSLRQALPVLRHGTFEVIATQGSAIAFRRRLATDDAVIAVNAGGVAELLYLPVPGLEGRTLVPRRWPGCPAGNVSDEIPVIDGWAAIELAPRDGAVLVAT